jgi:YVTN family beta-propeller protein
MIQRLTFAACLCLFASVAVAAQSHTVIVLSHNDHSVYELDPETGKVLHEFKAPDQPHEAAISADGKTIYASIPLNASLIEILDASTFKEKGKIESDLFKKTPPRGGRPAATPAQTASGPRAGGRGGDAGNVAAQLETTALPHGVALTNDGSKLYIGIENADVPGLVEYDTKTGQIVKKIDLLLKGGHYFQIQPGTDKLYYPHRDDDRVVVLDTKTDKIMKIIPVQGGPVGVGFAPNGEVWIHGDGDKAVGDGWVTVIDSKTDQVIKTIQTGGKGAGRMAVSPDGKWAASTHGTSLDVAIINTAKKEVERTVMVGKGPGFPLFSPDSMKLYVMNSGDGNVSVIDLKTKQVTASHKVGTDPFGGGIRIRTGSSN